MLPLALGAAWRKPTLLRCPRLACSTSTAAWNEEWRRLGLGAKSASEATNRTLNRLMFVQCGFGCDQHGDRASGGATQAAVRACRNAIEFNSIPGMVDHVPGGRHAMLIKVRLGVPDGYNVDHDQIRATFPYGNLLPIEVIPGGLTYASGRVVTELGDTDDTAVIVAAAVSIGYHDPSFKGGTVHDSRDK